MQIKGTMLWRIKRSIFADYHTNVFDDIGISSQAKIKVITSLEVNFYIRLHDLHITASFS